MATLSSLLLGGVNSKDPDLDALFARTKAEPARSKVLVEQNGEKPPAQVVAAAELANHKSQVRPSQNKKTTSAKRSQASQNEDSDDNEAIEDLYVIKQARKQAKIILAGRKAPKGKSAQVTIARGATEDTTTSSDDEGELVHETDLKARQAASGSSSKGKTKAKEYIDESPADKDARTTFLGNVPIACVTKKTIRKALVKHLISTLPIDEQALIRLDSIRFRSLPLAAPVPIASGTKQPAVPSQTNAAALESRARKRARHWREDGADSEENDDGGQEMSAMTQSFLTAAQKRRVAFIRGEVHGKSSACNAYAVWTTKDPEKASAKSLAALVIKHANNTVFENLTLRVDFVKSLGQTVGGGESEMTLEMKQSSAMEQKKKVEEEKRTVYIGSLDFEEKEQAVRDLCEKLMKEEKGPAPILEGQRESSYVERVRIVKDLETGLGKGFAYVLFKDRECVDEMLALDATRVRLSKRKLRLERCKSSSKAAVTKKLAKSEAKTADDAKVVKNRKEKNGHKTAPAIKPHEIPVRLIDNGESLRALPKSDRKVIKAADEERLKRRLEKKSRTRVAIGAKKAQELIDKKLKKTNAPKSGRVGTGKKNDGKKKSRTRSDDMEKKKNSKKV